MTSNLPEGVSVNSWITLVSGTVDTLSLDNKTTSVFKSLTLYPEFKIKVIDVTQSTQWGICSASEYIASNHVAFVIFQKNSKNESSFDKSPTLY